MNSIIYSSRERFDRSAPIVLSILLLVSGCSPKPPAPAEVVRPVKTMVVSAGSESNVRTFPGRVEAANKVELAFQVSGLLVSLPVREGQKVATNEVVAQLRQDEFQARLRALQGQLDRSRADLQALRAGARPEERLRLEAQRRAADAKLVNARTEFERSTQLLRNRVISRLEFDRAETAYQVAQQEYKAALQTFEQGRSRVRKTSWPRRRKSMVLKDRWWRQIFSSRILPYAHLTRV